MIVAKRISLVRLFKLIWLRLLCITAVACISVVPLIYFKLAEYAINPSIPEVIGIAIAIFLGFRTNSAYDRWWEARRLWGGILNESLCLGRLSRDLIGGQSTESDQLVRQICYRQFAWAYTFDRRLKNRDAAGILLQHLDPLEAERIVHSTDPAFALLLLQSHSLRQAYDNQWIDSYQHCQVQDVLSNLSSCMYNCNRIRNTQFPIHYTWFTKGFIWIFLLLLGCSLPSYERFGMEESASYVAIPAIILIGWIFFTVDGIGDYMQSPFEENRNVIPMRTLSREIEIGLRSILGETDLPPSLEPVDGVLM